MHSNPEIHDLLIIGGGINGAGIARDAAGRGLSVVLCEMGDLAGATSWASSKLIHGGLRYLEHGQFHLVRESLQEREILLRIAPHLTHPLRFVIPHTKQSRSAWLVRLGLWLYDHIGGSRTLPACESLKLEGSKYGAPLQEQYRKAHVYSDVQVDDARLTLANAQDAATRGARILPRTKLLSAERVSKDGKSIWRCRLQPQKGDAFDLFARTLVNVAGPWAAQMHSMLGGRERIGIQLVRGSHIVVPSLFESDHAYTLQHDDGRIVFLMPFHSYTLIGTTEVRESDPDQTAIASDEEVAYLCNAANRYLKTSISPNDVVWKFAGVRPLLDDGKRTAETNSSRVSREYKFVLDQPTPTDAALLTIIGGKLTTYRRLAEKALEKLSPGFPQMGPAWTSQELLPDKQQAMDWVAGHHFGAGLFERDIRYMIKHEWAYEADDFLWRRTKAGLRMTVEQRKTFADWLETNR